MSRQNGPETLWPPERDQRARRMQHYTVRLDASRFPRDKVGGKAIGLHRLHREGFPVPSAFCITTDAFEEVIEAAVRKAKTIDELRELLAGAELPRRLVEEIDAQMKYIGAPRWAVRSSGLEEDQKAHSFAGQQTTVLDVQGFDEVLDAMREVWASLYNLEGLLYRSRLDVGVVPRPMAVVVQAMLAPSVAGVLFTANPLSGDRSEIVVSAALGLGETVVSGGASTTCYLEKGSGYLRRHTSLDESKQVISRTQLVELARAAESLENIFGHPQDVEWAFVQDNGSSKGQLYFLQSRPITFEGATSSAPSVWTNSNVGEALPGVATPLTWSIIRGFSRKGFEQAFATLGLSVPDEYELVGSFRGRVFLNLTQFMSVASGIPILKPERLFSMAGGGGVELVKDIYEQRSQKQFWRRLPATIPKIIAAQLSMPLVSRMWGRYFTECVDEFFDRDLSLLDTDELLGELDHIDTLFDRTGLVMLTTSSNFLMSYIVTAELLRLLGGPQAAQRERELFAGMDVKSAEPGLALLELGRLVRRSLRLRRLLAGTPPADVPDALAALAEEDDVAEFLAALDDFRFRYGHRAPREAELATPRWHEEMGFLFEVLKSFVEAPHLPSSIEVERDRRRGREGANEIIETFFFGPFKGIFRLIWTFARTNAKLRESMRDRVVESLDLYRRFFRECGRRMTELDILCAQDDVFFLTYEEIRGWLKDPATSHDFAVRVLVRRTIFDAFRKQPDPPDTFLLRGTEIIPEDDIAVRIQTGEEEGGGMYLEIRGLPGSSGKATGRARVIHDPNTEDATIRPGEILIAPYTDVGWTPLFLTASAVVMSLGGPLSHSCIVAREYGIPTVVNAKRATEIIRTGDLVTVDGDRGVVYVRQSEAEE
ncbi:MAG: PEP/pyruvate-binding domain-containing protein [Bradymonadaceae bacterium]